MLSKRTKWHNERIEQRHILTHRDWYTAQRFDGVIDPLAGL